MSKRTYEEIDYEALYDELRKINMPILTLDKGWHDLFWEGKSKEIQRLEKELTTSLKGQGKIKNDREELNNLKKTLMKQIVENMDAGENSKASKKMEKSKQLIDEINDRLILLEDKQLDLPDEIQDANAKLMLAGMKEMLPKAVKNTSDIEELEAEIALMKEEVKQKVLLRQQKIEENEMIHKYLNRTVGRTLVNKYEEYLKREE
jgi:hypothetical protein